MAKYDEVIKRLGRLKPVDFVRWTCSGVGEIEEVSFEDREFELTYRRVDLLYRVKSKDAGEFLLHLEFQTDLKPDFTLRLHEYGTRIRREFGLTVLTVAIFLESTPAIKKLEPVDRCELGGELLSFFRDHKIVLPDEDWRTIMDKRYPAIMPLIPLANIPEGQEKEAISQAIQAIEQISDSKLRGELAAVLYLIGGYRYTEEIKQTIGEKLMLDLMESKTYRETVEIGENRGEFKGERKGTLKDLFKIINLRFGGVPEPLRLRLEKISSIEILDRLVEQAITCKSLTEFEDNYKV